VGSAQFVQEESPDYRPSWRRILEGMSFDRCVRILFLVILIVFAWYLLEVFVDGIEEVLQRLASNRPLNLPVKLSVIFSISHLLSIPFAAFLIVRDLIHDDSREA
jgi:hypothetical protein